MRAGVCMCKKVECCLNVKFSLLFSLQLKKLTDAHDTLLGRLELEQEDESNTRFTMDKRLADLRREVISQKDIQVCCKGFILNYVN